jgi:2-polyprenyl-6-methoxyphenol hydroxylase-like FAD-dependent oxidoreductase
MIYDVVIAGGGPVGLFLACELDLAGTSVIVLEKMEDPHSPLKESWMGMRGLNFPSVDALYRRGMLKDVQRSSLAWLDPARPSIAMNSQTATSAPAPRFAGHFAGIMLDANNIDLSDRKYLVQGPSSGGGIVSLEGIEEVLLEHAKKLDIDVRWGAPITDFNQNEDGVTVHTEKESFQGKFLVGCDGGRSTVRKVAGFEFEGTDPEFTGYSAWVEMADPEKLRAGFNLTPHGMYVNGPGPGRIGLVDFDDAAFDRSQEITLEDLQAILRRVSGTDVTLTALHVATSYTDRARQATTYRRGRVLLAGDAAHIHSPLGGQGLNTGLGDAMNLGWKLAATIKGWAPEGLLDSYTAERHPIGAWALNWTRAQVAIMRPNPHSQAIASVIRDLINTKDGTSYFVEKISGISMRYDLPGDHPLIGRSAPDFEFEDGSRLGPLLQDGTGLLLDFTNKAELNTLARRWNERLKYGSAQAKDNLGLAALLLRPDGFVAWATDTDPDLIVLEETIRRWFGNPD